jgi:hypothetical protein
MKTKNILLLAATVLSLGVVACGDDGETTSSGTGGGSTGTGTDATTSTTTTGSPTSTSSGGDGGGPTSTGVGGEGGGTGGSGGEGGSGPPAIPELGPQLERMGRPAINTATVETFLTQSGGNLGPTTDVIRSGAEDDYNAAANGSDEAAAFIPTMALQLTVLDSLDGTCGNSLAWGLNAPEGDCVDSATGEPIVCYAGLATVLSADALWVKTDYESCGIYLGVEADGAGIIANTDCGGRRPVDDVIRTTYSAVSGAVNPADPQIFLFDDEIDPPADLHPETFPFLAAPYAE